MPKEPVALTIAAARRLWLHAQRLDTPTPFGGGAAATPAAVRHLGYVQIDTINVIERCHHHILWTRIPDYRRAHLAAAQSVDRSVFEYWTHALAYVPAEDFRFFLPAMAAHRRTPKTWFGAVTAADVRKAVARLRDDGPLTIRDIDDDVLVDKHHPWASRKPSKRALQRAFYDGAVTISARAGMLKTYELTARHFGFERLPKPARAGEVAAYRLDRALRAQGVVSLDGVCYLEPRAKTAVRPLVAARVRRGTLVPVALPGGGEYWATPDALDATLPPLADDAVHLLSPFDPLVIDRKRLNRFFGYAHRFEAYLPQAKRQFGYFALPVLMGDEIIAAIDLKADRAAQVLRVQRWTWVAEETPARRAAVEAALGRFAAFQFAVADALD